MPVVKCLMDPMAEAFPSDQRLGRVMAARELIQKEDPPTPPALSLFYLILSDVSKRWIYLLQTQDNFGAWLERKKKKNRILTTVLPETGFYSKDEE